MFQWKIRLAALYVLTALVAAMGGRWGRFEWLHWGW